MEQIHVKEFITVHRIVFNRQAAGEDRVGVTTLVGLRQPEFNCNVLSLSTQSPNASSLRSLEKLRNPTLHTGNGKYLYNPYMAGPSPDSALTSFKTFAQQAVS